MVLSDAPVLILDEPTSSVDVNTEAAIMETMYRLMEGRMTFVIAHRLSTLDGCDERIEIASGRVNRTREECVHMSKTGFPRPSASWQAGLP